MNEKAKADTAQCPHIHGIHCQVKNCCHNGENDCCTAKEVHVGPQIASCQAETICATFKAR